MKPLTLWKSDPTVAPDWGILSSSPLTLTLAEGVGRDEMTRDLSTIMKEPGDITMVDGPDISLDGVVHMTANQSRRPQ